MNVIWYEARGFGFPLKGMDIGVFFSPFHPPCHRTWAGDWLWLTCRIRSPRQAPPSGPSWLTGPRPSGRGRQVAWGRWKRHSGTQCPPSSLAASDRSWSGHRLLVSEKTIAEICISCQKKFYAWHFNEDILESKFWKMVSCYFETFLIFTHGSILGVRATCIVISPCLLHCIHWREPCLLKYKW